MIRQMKKNDKKELERVCDIWLNESYKVHNFIDDYKNFWLKKKGNFILETIGADGYVWEEDGIIKGFMTIKDNYIYELFIDSVWQSKGIGKSLINLAKSLKKESLETDVYEKNAKAIDFYEKREFVKSLSRIEEETGQSKFRMKWNKEDP